MLEGSADLGISVLPRAMAALETIPLFAEEASLYCGRGLRYSRPRTAMSLRKSSLSIGSSAQAPPMTRALRCLELRRSAASAPRRSTLACFLLSEARCSSSCRRHYARRWVEEGKLRPIGGKAFTTTNMFHLFFKKAARLGAAASHLRRIILDAFEADRPGQAG